MPKSASLLTMSTKQSFSVLSLWLNIVLSKYWPVAKSLIGHQMTNNRELRMTNKRELKMTNKSELKLGDSKRYAECNGADQFAVQLF